VAHPVAPIVVVLAVVGIGVPGGARISAGKSGSVEMVFPVMAERSEKIVPVSCIPSPESPEKRITMSLRVLTAFCSSIALLLQII